MFLREIVATLRRRWYLTIVGLTATAGLCFAAMSLVPPSYGATGSIVLLPPASSVVAGGNPYLQLGGLDQVVAVLVRSLGSQASMEAVAASVPNGSYEVAPDYATSGPILVITADNKSPEATLATLNDVIDMASPSLAALQESVGIAPASRITAHVLTSDNQPEVSRKAQIRALIVAAGIGLLGSALVIALVDSWMLRRRAGREDALSPVAETSPVGSVGVWPAPRDEGATRTGRLGWRGSDTRPEPRTRREIEPARRSRESNRRGSNIPPDEAETGPAIANGSPSAPHTTTDRDSSAGPTTRRVGLHGPPMGEEEETEQRPGGSSGFRRLR